MQRKKEECKIAKPVVTVVHGDVCFGCKPGEHQILVSMTGNLNYGKRSTFKGSFQKAVKEGKRRVMKLGEGARLWTHGASENTVDYVVHKGKLYYAIPTALKNGRVTFLPGKPAR